MERLPDQGHDPEERAPEGLRARERQQAAVAELGQRALDDVELSALMEQAVALVAQTLEVEFAGILELLPDGQHLAVRACTGWGMAPNEAPLIPAGKESQAGYTLFSREPVVMDDLSNETRFSVPQIFRGRGVRSGLTTIVGGRQQAFGILGAHSTQVRHFTDDDVHFLQSIAHVLAAAIERKRSDEELRASEERYRLVSRATSDIVWDWNLLTDEVKRNEGITNLLGYPADESGGPGWFCERIHPEDRSRIMESLRTLFETGERYWSGEYRYRRHDGSYAHILDRGYVVHDVTGRALRMIGSMGDISERKRAEAERDLFFSLSVDLMVIADYENGSTLANPAWERLLGHTREELRAIPILDLVHPEDHEASEAVGARLMAGESVAGFENRVRCKDGQYKWISWSAGASPTEKRIYAAGRDITERKRAEQLQQAVYRIAQAATGVPDLQSLYPAVHETIGGVMAANNFYIAIYDEDEDLLSFPYFADEVDAAAQPKRPGNGLTEYVLRTGRPLLCKTETHEELQRRGEADLIGTPSPIWLGVPLIVEQKTIGVMVVQHYSDPMAYGERELAVLEYVSSQVAHAIDSKRSEEKIRVRARQQAAAAELGQQALAATDLQALLQSTVELVGRTLDVEYCTVLELLPDGKSLIAKTGVGWEPGFIGSALISASPDTQAGYTLLCDSSVVVDDLRRETRFTKTQILRDHGVISGMSTVVQGPSGPFGVLGAHTTRRRSFTGDDIYFLRAVANVLAMFIERKEAEDALREAEVRTRLIVDTALDAIITMHSAGLVTGWNPQAEAIFGWSREEAVGRTLADLIIPERYKEGHRRGMQRFLATGQGPVLNRRIEIQGQHRDGREIPVELTVSPARVGEDYIFSAFIRDISARKAAEAELQRAKEAAETATQAKSEFLANMSHEIRTPMNGIIGFVDLLSDTALDEEQKDYLGTVRQSAHSLLAIINDILDFSKIEAGKLELERTEFDPCELLESVGELLAARAQEKGLELVCGTAAPPIGRLLGDPLRLTQILVNLVGNAVKFTERGEVVVGMETVDESPERALLRVTIHDTGIGIPADRMDRLFQSFSQVDGSTTRRFGGTGLGLAISHRLAQLMGGSIVVRSEPGVGTTFVLALPFERVAAGDTRGARLPEDRRGLRVLVVDAHTSSRELLRGTLEMLGCAAAAAHDALAARALLLESVRLGEPYGIVFLDLPAAAGPAALLLESLRNDPALGTPLRCLLSPLQGRKLATEADAAARVLVKPVKRSAILEILMAAEESLPGPGVQPDTSAAGVSVQPHAMLPGLEPARILIAEDNPVNQRVILALLGRLGLGADVACNGREAVQASTRQRYDLIFMDVQMPELDGQEATAAIRGLESAGVHVPIVAMTARAMPGDRERCLEAGMDGFLTKPVRRDELEAALHKWLGGRARLGDGSGATADAPAAASDPVRMRARLRELEILDQPEVLREVVEAFAADSSAKVASLLEALQAGDLGHCETLAHGLKGAAANMGAEQIADLAMQFEAAARAGDAASCRPLFDALSHAHASLSIFLTSLCPTTPEGSRG